MIIFRKMIFLVLNPFLAGSGSVSKFSLDPERIFSDPVSSSDQNDTDPPHWYWYSIQVLRYRIYIFSKFVDSDPYSVYGLNISSGVIIFIVLKKINFFLLLSSYAVEER